MLVLLSLALFPNQILGFFGGGDTASSAPLAPETAYPDQAPPAQKSLRPTLAEPFRGSPAAQWENGSAGITLPAPKATGWMSAAQVAQALDASRTFLVASNLDPHVLRGQRPAKAIALINPHQQDMKKYLSTSFQNPSTDNDPLMLFSRLNPSQTSLVGSDIKTRGHLTYKEGERGALQVSADVTFVYPTTRAGGHDGKVVRTIVRRELVMSWDDPTRVITQAGTFSVISNKLDMTNGGCGQPTGFFTPSFDEQQPSTGTQIDPYDRSTPMKAEAQTADGGCRTAVRS
ncbi:hypothetical protein ACFVUQ_25105 [Streptomyces cyaneofuscatus]|uniref:hypothetical protein n=1 Tax=Streptomyces cyaneofuscatus TaxID=66883 RepID=UPI0036DEBEAE